jgi:choline dehydrogenase-like flavoprotein
VSTAEQDPLGWLSSPEQATLAAAVARIVPRDADPGAVEAGVLDYLAGFLGGVDRIHAAPDGERFLELGARERAAWEQRISMLRDKYRTGLRDLERRALERYRQPFAELGEDQQDALLAQLEEDSGVRGGRPPANQPVSSDDEPFLVALAMHVRQGYYCDPAYGGNRDRAGWRMIGFDGPDGMPDVRLGRYTTRAYLGASRHEQRAGQADPEPAQVAEPAGWAPAAEDEVDICIVGSGAGGGMAAYLLCRAGLRVAMLERGPWMRAEDFAPDELAAFNRYQIWPDPRLHPRTYRPDAHAPARIQEFSPMPALVGGGTIHWSAWTPRPLASDFRPRSEVGELPGASLVDWPIGYSDLEPYMDRVERLLGVGGIAGANTHEEPRRNPFPLPPLPQSRYGERFDRGCRELGLSSFPMPQAIPVRPWAGRPASRDNGFVQQYGDSTDAKASSLNACIGPALATGRLDLRSGSVAYRVEADRGGRATGVAYLDEAGRERVVRARAVIVACGAIETARLLLMSATPAIPDGLAGGSGQLGANLMLHEYTFAIGLFEDGEPIYGWAGSYEGGCTFDLYRHDERRGHALGCLVSCSGLGHPINFTYPGKPIWGGPAKDADRAYFNHSLKVGVLAQDLPQESNRVDLDPSVRDAWGLPVARVTHAAHPNDLALANWTVDRAAQIAEAAGATRVLPVHIDRITGNCAHQYGTARMGVDPDASVVDPAGRAHEVENLLVLDGSVFPSSTGVNPTLLIMANAWRCCELLLRQGPRR